MPADPPDEVFTCDQCQHEERIPVSYIQDIMARNREWFLQQLHVADNFNRPGRRLMFRGRVDGGKVVATAEKRIGTDGEREE